MHTFLLLSYLFMVLLQIFIYFMQQSQKYFQISFITYHYGKVHLYSQSRILVSRYFPRIIHQKNQSLQNYLTPTIWIVHDLRYTSTSTWTKYFAIRHAYTCHQLFNRFERFSVFFHHFPSDGWETLGQQKQYHHIEEVYES